MVPTNKQSFGIIATDIFRQRTFHSTVYFLEGEQGFNSDDHRGVIASVGPHIENEVDPKDCNIIVDSHFL